MDIEQALRATLPTGRLQRFKDSEQAGLYLRVASGGKAAYIARAKGSTSDRKIGEPETMTLAEAREQAAALRPAPSPARFEQPFTARTAPTRARRIAPSREVALAEPGGTVADAWAIYLEWCELRVERNRMALRTLKSNRNWYRNNIAPTLAAVEFASVSRHDIERAVADCPPATRNRVLRLISAFFNTMQRDFGMREGLLNPTKGIERDREQWRKRTLSAAELQALSAALERWSEKQPNVVALIRFQLATPRRIGEARTLKWADVDMQAGVALFRDTKTGDDQLHALPPQALDVLQGLLRKNQWVFASIQDKAHCRDAGLSETHVRKTFKAILQDAGIPTGREHGVTLHDLRRTVATWAAEGGATPHQLRAMLGHKTTAMADRYVGQVDERAPVTAAAEAIAKAMRGG